MPVDRKLLTEPFFRDLLPPWPCSVCSRGHLTLLQNFDPQFRASATYRRLSRDHSDDIEDDFGVVALIAQCSYKDCKEAFSICGRYHSELGFDDRGFEFVLSVCNVVSITPSIHPITFPSQCPELVKEQFVAAFSIMWQNPNAALNRVRTALELLMDHFRVPRARASQKKKGVRKRVRLDLHSRIERLGVKRKSVADLVPALLAVKYLGNDGTHDTTATLDDLFDALDLSEGLLARLFDPSHITTEQIKNEVLKGKGRRKPNKS